ncbi:holliday junction resolvase [Roseibium sp. TrichSKD4]|uniref:hypothetical protein n=1 Tax=Roseibium sp. TrichSKD4 TaxID=744980 RepID=UPI0001E57328|nr:hypothetical protein [Roseibium sp. TrichSKD4]EFO29128.1 holliday junction resolvase [Roseibium sp. TrichSKD4]
MSDDDLFDGDGYGGDPYADAGDALARHRPDETEINGKKRPGRPKGSLNRKTKDFEKFFHAKGFRDPLVAMAQFLTADPVELQAWFEDHERAKTSIGKKVQTTLPSLMEIIKEQHTVASQLAPYLHGKKPVEIAILDERLPTLIVDLGTNQLEEGKTIAGRRALSLGQTIDATSNEINDLEDSDE